MSSSTYARLALLALVLVAGCSAAHGSGNRSTRTPPSSAPAGPHWPCLARFGARETATSTGLPVALIGSGDVAVVLSDESDEDACGWAPYLAALHRPQLLLALYDYGSDPAADLASVARLTRAQGARTVVLIGASEGAKASLIAAARVRPAAVVSLSAEATLAGEPVAPYAARLQAPTLFVTAADDPYGAAPATRAFYRADPAGGRRLLVVAGDAHGTALLANAAVRRTVVGFLAAREAAAAQPTPAPCGPGARAFWLPGPGGTKLEANAYGSGSAAVVFLHETGRLGMCGFWPYARWLAAHQHVLVVLFNRCTYGASTCHVLQSGDAGIAAQTQPAVAWARRHGARRVTLLGASSGGSDALQAAGVVSGVAAVVDLSGDSTDTGADDIADARRLRVPALFAVAPGDRYVSVARTRAVYRAAPSRPKRLVIVSGSDGAHGWDLLTAADGRTVTPLARRIAEWVTGRFR